MFVPGVLVFLPLLVPSPLLLSSHSQPHMNTAVTGPLFLPKGRKAFSKFSLLTGLLPLKEGTLKRLCLIQWKHL